MPNSIKETNLEDLCAQCKKPHGNSIVLQLHNHKVYESITCQNCGYENVRIKSEAPVGNHPETFHKIKT